MISNPNVQFTAWEIEIAKRIAWAVVSYKAGVAYIDLSSNMLIREKGWERIGFSRETVWRRFSPSAERIIAIDYIDG